VGRFTGLWRHPDFLKLWAGESISLIGSQITLLALPLAAVLTLNATAAQTGLLRTAAFAPFLLVGLFAGVWVDRMRRRPILIAADIGRALLLGSIPAAAALDLLYIEQLYLIAFLAGILTVFFDVAYQAFLPSLVRRDQLLEGNSKLEVSNSVAFVAGPGLAGGLVQLLTAAGAIALDAVSYLLSALFLSSIRTPEPVAVATRERRGVRAEIAEGLRVVVGNPLLRGIAGCTSTSNFFGSMVQAVFVLYATRELGLSAGALGLVLGAAGVGALGGALLAGWAARRFGLGRAMIGGILLAEVPWLALPLAGGPPEAATIVLGAAWFLGGLLGPIYNLNQVSLRQSITPHRLQGRMNATMRFLVWGSIPLGALLGGALGEILGVRATIAIGAAGGLLSVFWLLSSPVRLLREPTLAPDQAGTFALQ